MKWGVGEDERGREKGRAVMGYQEGPAYPVSCVPKGCHSLRNITGMHGSVTRLEVVGLDFRIWNFECKWAWQTG